MRKKKRSVPSFSHPCIIVLAGSRQNPFSQLGAPCRRIMPEHRIVFLSSFSICPDARRQSGKLPHKASILISSFQGCEAGQNTGKKSSALLFMESTDFFTSQTESCLLYVIYEITEKLGIPHGNTSDLTFASGTVQHPDDVSTAHVVSCQDESVAHILLI